METIETVNMREPETKIREGYKKTKIGWIPADWELIKLGDYVGIQSGVSPSNYTLSDSGTYPYLKVEDLNNCWKYQLTSRFYIEDNKSLVARGSIIFPKRGAAILNNKVRITRCLSQMDSNMMALTAEKENLDSEYLYYTIIRERLSKIADTSTIPQINNKHIVPYKIALPPLPKQKKIAQILSTWDVAIEQTQKLVEQLKIRKKGLMQQLLTGKTRLKGFDGEWEFLKGGELFKNHSDKNHNGDLEVLSATQDKGVVPRSTIGIDIKYDKKSLGNYKKVEAGDFVISLRSFQGGIEYSYYEGLVSPAYTVLKEAKTISKTFYKEYLKTESFITRLNSIIYGIRDGKQISYKEFATLKIAYPPIEEQQAIAKVLTAADEEIKAQENYLEQLQEQKKGLMQKLLTGEIRVNVNEAAN